MVRYFVNDKEYTYEEFCEQVRSRAGVSCAVSTFIDELARTNKPKLINGDKFEVDADLNFVILAVLAERGGHIATVASFNTKETCLKMKEIVINRWLAERESILSTDDFERFKRQTAFMVTEVLNYE